MHEGFHKIGYEGVNPQFGWMKSNNIFSENLFNTKDETKNRMSMMKIDLKVRRYDLKGLGVYDTIKKIADELKNAGVKKNNRIPVIFTDDFPMYIKPQVDFSRQRYFLFYVDGMHVRTTILDLNEEEAIAYIPPYAEFIELDEDKKIMIDLYCRGDIFKSLQEKDVPLVTHVLVGDAMKENYEAALNTHDGYFKHLIKMEDAILAHMYVDWKNAELVTVSIKKINF